MPDMRTPRPMGSPGRKPHYVRRPAALGAHGGQVSVPALRHASALKSGCATALGLSMLAMAHPALAQVNATANVVGGPNNAGVTNVGTTTNIAIRNSEVVIDWSALVVDGSDHIFLPAGSTANYFNDPQFSLTNYTVLNRINPVDAVTGVPATTNNIMRINGTVQSTFSGATGGTIWFYTPGGIIAGPTALFDIGSLVLTTSATDTADGLYGPSGEIRFTGAPVANSAVTIQAGARINAPVSGSYVAMVAPRVVQGGRVTVNGSTAYVGAEAANITINSGLFDIAITTGTDDANGVVHTGTTTGPASAPGSGTPDPQRIYMAAVPKNTALTMLLSGTIGYTAAGSAALEDSAVVLSAGYDISGGSVTTPSATGTLETAGITIGTGTFLSAVTGDATGDILLSPTAGTLAFNANGRFTAQGSITMGADARETITAASDLSLTSGTGAQGGTITVFANADASSPPVNGLIDITGQLLLDVAGNGNAGLSGTPDDGVDATGGTISITADGGTINAGTIVGLANALGGDGITRSGNATGGSISLSGLNNGVFGIGQTQFDASASAYLNLSGAPIDGGTAQGGTILITGDSGTLNLGQVAAVTRAIGGTATTGTAGDAIGGNVSVDVSGGSYDWTSLFADASAEGGFSDEGGIAGSATGSSISLDISGPGILNISDNVILAADAVSSGGGASGGALTAGQILVRPHDGGSLIIGQTFLASASAEASLSGVISGPPLATPDAIGGSIIVSAEGGSFQSGGLFVGAAARSISAQTLAGTATGGTISLSAEASGGVRGNFSVTGCGSFGCAIVVSALGANGATGSDATGGNVSIFASDADFSIAGPVSIQADGYSALNNSNGPIGDAFGGNVSIESRAGTLGDAVMRFDDLFVTANGLGLLDFDGPVFSESDGGTGTGGTAQILVEAGSFTAVNLSLAADGFGGYVDGNTVGTTPFQGGEGIGGAATFTLDGGTATIDLIDMHADGLGGNARQGDSSTAIPGITGAGTGGTASMIANDGTLTTGTIRVAALGYGGNGLVNGDTGTVAGGTGTGGTASLALDSASQATIVADRVEVSALGFGGAGSRVTFSSSPGGNGGNGIGGNAILNLSGGTFTVPQVQVFAQGEGGIGGTQENQGDGGNGGDGTGGSALFTGGSLGITISDVNVSADGRGGSAGESLEIVSIGSGGVPIYAYATGRGGNGGNGTGGSATTQIDLDPDFATLLISAKGIGSVGATSGEGGTGGTGRGGAALLNVAFGALNVTDSLTIISDGEAGRGGDGVFGQGGRGGNAIGGQSTLQTDSADSILSTGSLMSITANAYGGFGGGSGLFGGEGLNGAAGGNATGGTAVLRLTDGAQMSLGSLSTIAADAFGGFGSEGTVGPSGGNGGDGGDATAGTAGIALTGGELTADPAHRIEILANAISGIGAPGSNSNLAGGLSGQSGLTGTARGGTAAFTAVDGSFALGTIVMNAIADGDISGTGVGGTTQFINRDGALPDPASTHTTGQLTLIASGNTSAGRAEVINTATSGGLFVNGDLSVDVNGAPNGPNSGIFVSSAGSPLSVAGTTAFNSDTDISVDIDGDNGLALAGAFIANAAEVIRVRHTNQNAVSPFDSIGAASIDLRSVEVDAAPTSLLRAADYVSIITSGSDPLGNIRAGDIVAGSYIDIQSRGIVATGDLTAGTDVVVTTLTDDNITLGNVTAGDDVWLIAQGVLASTTITTGAIVSTGLGDDSAATSTTSFAAYPGFAGPAGNLILLHSDGGVNEGDITNLSGRTILAAERGNIVAGSLSAPEGIALLTHGNVSIGGATTDGRFQVADFDMFASLTDAYDPDTLNGLTPIATLGTLNVTGPISAGTVLVNTTGNLSLNDVRATNEITIRTSGSLNGASFIAGTNALLTAPQGISLSRLSTGGTAALTATNGAIAVTTDLNTGGGLTATGQSIDLTSLGNVLITQADATVTDLRIQAGGTLTFTTLNAARDISATGLLVSVNGIGTATATRNLSMSGSNGIATNLLSAGGTMILNAATGAIVTHVSATGLVSASGRAITLDVSAPTSFSQVIATAGNVQLNAGLTDITVGNANASGNIIINARNVNATRLAAGAFLNVTSGNSATVGTAIGDAGIDIVAGNTSVPGIASLTVGTANSANGDIRLRSLRGPLSITNAVAGGNFTAFVRNGSFSDAIINATGDIEIFAVQVQLDGTSSATAGGNLTINATNGITASLLSAGGTAQLNAATGAIQVASLSATGLVSALAQSIDITGPGSLNFASADATAGALRLQTIGALIVDSGSATGAVQLISTGGAVTGGQISGSSVTVDAADDASIDTATATNAVTVTAGGTARFIGTTQGQEISVASGDIAIGSAGRLIALGSNGRISLTNSNDQRATFIGGADDASGYSLSANEIGRLGATNIAIFAPVVSTIGSASLGSPRQPDVFVRGFTLNPGSGSSGSGASGSMRIQTSGKLRVEGDVRFIGVSSGYRFEIDAGEAIEVIAGSGSIDMRDNSNALSGSLAFRTDDFIAATLQAIDDVAAATTLDARSDRLDRNDGVLNEDGMLRAGAITIDVINGVYIQNTGLNDTIAARRGFTANTLDIGTEGADTQIVLNGRLTGDLPGSFMTGLQALPLVSINGVAGSQTGQFDDRSTINGCLISNPASCSIRDNNPSDRDTIDEILTPDNGGGTLMPLALIEIAGFEEQGYPPLIDEPVTGAGNDDLWLKDCQPDEKCPETLGN